MARQRIARYPPSSTESQWFFTREELDNSPSIQQGMDWKEERRNRQRMIQILWQFRGLGRAPQVAINTAATLLQRFYMRNSFQQWDKYIAVAAAYFLACKIEERPINSKNVTSMLRYLLDPRSSKDSYKFHESEFAVPDFIAKRKEILRCEETMLRMECFDMNLRHPHPFLGKLVPRVWSKGKGPEVVKAGARVLDVSWFMANDTLSAPICLLYRPQLIAACCIALACIVLRQPLPGKPLSLSEQRTLWDLDREEGEEETEESAFQEDVYWLELLDVRSDELRDPILFILENWKLAQDAFVADETELIRPRILKALDELLTWPPAPLSGTSIIKGEEEGSKASPTTNGNGGAEKTETNGAGRAEVQGEEDVKMEEVKP
ncbi:hypothetical protein JCM3765_000864 [Sporobolomyces pararoseus]